MGKLLTRKLRLWHENRQICGICLQTIDSITEANVDHIIPKSKGGGNTLDNLQLAHIRCNYLKGDRLV